MGTAVSTGGERASRSLASWWRGRYGAKLLFEILICGALLIIYRTIRMVNKTDLRTAFSNAREIVRFEEWLGLPFEDNLQGFLLDHPTLIKLLNHYYIWFHFPMAIGLLLWLYLRHHDRYQPIRNLMAFVTFAALIIHLVFPLAPPRMMSGFVDTMREFGPSIYPANAVDGAANQIAAMPSLHFGWAMIEAMAVVSVLKSGWRWLIMIHPALMTLSIIATANHWWIDAAAAALIVLGAVAVWRLAQAWSGGRRFIWSRLRFESDVGIEQIESFASERAGSDASERACSDVNEPVDC
jgi:hypothetical protein